jgi:carbon-monoxide dehydrogenase small subunit
VSSHKVSIILNGEKRSAEVEARTLLVHFIRETLGLTGTHIGCDTTSCGACTVSLDGHAVKSCTIFAVQAEGLEVGTIEGVAANGKLHPLQEGFWEKHGLQCGFCTPGMIVSAVDFAKQTPNPTESDVRHWLEGNICRCTGYQNIVASVLAGAAAMRTQAGG